MKSIQIEEYRTMATKNAAWMRAEREERIFLGIRPLRKFAFVQYDLWTSNVIECDKLIDTAVKEIMQLYINYLDNHKVFKKSICFSAGHITGGFKVLRTDSLNYALQLKEILEKPLNWQRLEEGVKK